MREDFSNEHSKTISYELSLCKSAEKKLEIYSQKISQIDEIINNGDYITKKYSCGGDLHRGYYAPSPSIELMVGNVKRGKLTSKLSDNSKISYEYIFCNGFLIKVTVYDKRNPTNTTNPACFVEYIFNENDYQIGITFDTKTNSIYYLTEVVKAGDDLFELREYIINDNRTVFQLTHEIYKFKGDLLDKTEYYTFLPHLMRKSKSIGFTHSDLLFHYDKNGIVDFYISYDYDFEGNIKFKNEYYPNKKVKVDMLLGQLFGF
ncbi:MAG: hypothetical protein ACI4VI_10050 [Acutalibacteraceae bacterium]